MIDATRLSEGIHFITVRAYRHQPAGSPAVFSDFKKVIYIDRLPPSPSSTASARWKGMLQRQKS